MLSFLTKPIKNPFAGLFSVPTLENSIRDEVHSERLRLQKIESLIDQLDLDKALCVARITALRNFSSNLHKRKQNVN